MLIKSAEFIKSSSKLRDCPLSDLNEYAFIGRSNVGKSSLINMLLGRRKVAKTSSTPGKTQLINHFLINDEWYIVDLPGYGYAKASKESRIIWQNFIFNYLQKRDNLVCLFLLIDSRHEPMKIDLDFINWLGTKSIPFVFVFTKSDKISKRQLKTNIDSYKNKLLETWENLPEIFVASTVTLEGKEEILKMISDTNRGVKN